MNFYFELGNYYEGVFPLNQYKLRFLQQNIAKKGLTLDIACGVGTDAIALHKLGFSIEGLDLEQLMIKRAKQNALNENIIIPFTIGSMLDISKLYTGKTFANILCTGNSLVHLSTVEGITSFIHQSYNLLQKNGTLLIQIINFDRVLDQNITELPTINNDEKGITFVRNYEYDKSKHKIKFITKLTADKEFHNVIELLPLRKNELHKILTDSGFNDVNYFGSFKGDSYNKSSYATIVVAKKQEL